MLRGRWQFLAGAAGAAGSRLAASVIVARVVGPAAYGLWALSEVLIMYAPLLAFGMANGLRRELANQPSSVDQQRMISTAVLLGFLSSSILAFALPFLLWPDRLPLALQALTALAAGTTTTQQSMFVAHRAFLRFELIGRIQLMGAAVTLGFLAILLLAGIGVYALPAALASGALFSTVMAWAQMPESRTSSIRIRLALELGMVGMPIALAGTAYIIWSSLDRLAIERFLGVAALGQYFPALMVATVLSFLRTLLSERFYPQIVLAHLGKHPSGASAIDLARRENRLTLMALTGTGLMAAALLPFIVPFMLPAYRDGVQPAQIVALGFLVIGLGAGYGDYLNAVGRQNTYLLFQLAALALSAIAMIAVIKAIPTLNGAALGFVFASVLQGLGLLALVRVLPERSSG